MIGTLNPPGPERELSELIKRVGSRLVEAKRLTRWVSPQHRRASWLLRFADGRAFKGRRLASAAGARRVEALLASLGERHFPRLLARHGPTLLLEWVDGRSLLDTEWKPLVLTRCGALHGWIHTRPVPDGMALRCRRPRWGKRLERGLAILVGRGVLGEREAAALGSAATPPPPTVAHGIVHRDLCADNLVLRASGKLCPVDNETLAVDAYAYDLGRTWYRWPMRPDQQAAYFEGYRRYRSPADFWAHSRYWTTLVLVESTGWHLRLGTAGAAVPLRRLHELLRDELAEPPGAASGALGERSLAR